MIKRINSRVIFSSQELYDTYKKLETGNSENKKLFKWITRAIQDLKEDAFCGLAIPKRQIPKRYEKIFNAKTIWKYDLPRAFRLIYTIENKEVEVFAIVLEWFDHKEYEKKFKY